MKRIFLIYFLLLSLASYGQEIIDNKVTFRAEYEFQYRTDPTSTLYTKDILYLDVCESGQSFFYSRNRAYRDSLKRVYLADGFSPQEVMEKIRIFPNGILWTVNKRFKNNVCKYHNKLISSYSCEYPLTLPQWELHSDTLTLCGFVCQKATANFMGRIWTVWFAPQVVNNDGPWMLWGLPGLILKASDSNNHFSFTCTEVGKLQQTVYTLTSADLYATKQISFQQMLNLEKLFHTDFDSFLEQTSGARKMGERNKIRKYIPLVLKF